MPDDVHLRERVRAVWEDISVSEPDLVRIRRRGTRRRFRRAFGAGLVTLIVGAGLVIPLSRLAGLSDSRESSRPGGNGPSTASPEPPSPTDVPGIVPTDTVGNVLAEGIAGWVTCFTSVGDANVLASGGPDPLTVCADSLRREGVAFSGEWTMCATPGYLHVHPAEHAVTCEGILALPRLPDGYAQAVAKIAEARARIVSRYPHGGTPCFHHRAITQDVKDILVEAGLRRWNVVDRWKADGSACAYPSVWDFELFQVHVLNEP